MDLIDYKLFLNAIAKNRKAHPLREMYIIFQKLKHTDVVNLVQGLPSPAGFPMQSITLNLKDGTSVHFDESLMQKSQQYTATSGMPEYHRLLETLVRTLHHPPCLEGSVPEAQTQVMPTAGGTDCCSLVLDTILDAGDLILVEEYTYIGITSVVASIGAIPILVRMDEEGMIPESLREVLSKWDPDAAPGTDGKPKLLSVIPTGQNPTGSTYSLARKQQIYQIAHEYNILIYEDDPYYFITYGKREPSFLSLDTDGRVLRGDTFSKCIAPGIRAGYVTGPRALMEIISHNLDATSFGTSSLSQGVVLSLFAHWGVDGFIARAERNVSLYREKRDIAVKFLDKWLGDRVEYCLPKSGMHLWFSVKGCDDTSKLMQYALLKHKVSVNAGQYFQALAGSTSSYIRISFGTGSAEYVDEALRRLSEAIDDYLKAENCGN